MASCKFDPYEHLNVIQNEDGTLTRLLRLPNTPATGEDQVELGQAVVSKDVTLNEDKKTWMRIYRPSKLPSNDKSVARLPILMYFHAGQWVHFSVGNTIIHDSLNTLCSELPAIVIGVDYRLAPENRLPAQYDDAVDSILWVKEQATNNEGDQWLRDYGDFSRCYLYGISCGGNIAFNTSIRILDHNLSPIRIAGVILNQPLFGGKQRTKSELKLATDEYFPLPVIDLLWDLALPPGTDRDHRFCNPMIDGPYQEKMKHIGRCLVIGFGGDPLVDRQQDLVQILVKQGVRVEARFDDVGFHLIDMIDTRRATAIINFIKDFV